MKLVVGLGNPGKKYAGTRHNIGFVIIQKFLEARGAKALQKDKFEAEIVQVDIDGEQVIFAMPQTFMNLSGSAVQKISKFFKIDKKDILVIHDDVALDFGRLRLVFDRGAGGQHGVEDIMERFGGSKAFHRLKVGVGPDPGGEYRADYVLENFPKAEAERYEQVVAKSLEVIGDWLRAFGSEEGLDLKKQDRIVQKYNTFDVSLATQRRKEFKEQLKQEELAKKAAEEGAKKEAEKAESPE